MVPTAIATASSMSATTANPAGDYEILGPSEAFLERAKGIFRWDILIKAPEVGKLQRALRRARELCARNKWPCIVDVDPYGVS